MKKLLTVFVVSALLFQPANDTISQNKPGATKKPDTLNSAIKEKVDVKADTLKAAIQELKQAVIEQQKPEIKYITKWRTRPAKTVHDTIWQCPPSDSSGYEADEPEVIIKHDTVPYPVHDTIVLKNKTLWQKVKSIF